MIVGMLFGLFLCGLLFVGSINQSGGLDWAPAVAVLIVAVSLGGLIGALVDWLCR